MHAAASCIPPTHAAASAYNTAINTSAALPPPAYHYQQHFQEQPHHDRGCTATATATIIKYNTSPSLVPSSRSSDAAHSDSSMLDDSARSSASSEHIRGVLPLAFSPGSLGTTPVKRGDTIVITPPHNHQTSMQLPPPAYTAARKAALAHAVPVPRRNNTAVTAAPPSKPRRHDPYAIPKAAYTVGVAHGISHQPLVGQCRYVAWPEIAPIDSKSKQSGLNLSSLPPRVIVDQVKFELTGPQLRWLIHHLCGVVPVHVAALDRGAFAVYYATEADSAAAAVLHRGLLFDHNGAWAPATATESAAVARYMGSREFRQRGQRLPRELMSMRGGAGNSGKHHHQQSGSTRRTTPEGSFAM